MPQYNRYTPDSLGQAISASRSWSDVARYFSLKDSGGGSRAHLQGLAVKWEISTSHFTGQSWNRGTVSSAKVPAMQVLMLGTTVRPTAQLRRALLEIGRLHQCEECGIGPVWNGKRLVLHIDHRSGNRLDNQPPNLRFLCPNCHSQTDNFGIANSRIVGKKQRTCIECNQHISRRASRCRSCNQKWLQSKVMVAESKAVAGSDCESEISGFKTRRSPQLEEILNAKY